MSKNTKHKIELVGCDDTTSFYMELTDGELNLLLIKRVSELSKETSEYGCMPTMWIDEPSYLDSLEESQDD